MPTSAPGAGSAITAVRTDEDHLIVDLRDGRTISVPLAWYPRLLHASPEQRGHWEIVGGGFGIHWPEIDEDLSIEGILSGAPSPSAQISQGA